MQTLLADRLYAATVNSLGASERLQIAGLIRDADKTVVREEVVAAVSAAFDRHPWEFERNLDVIEPLSQPLWMEWPAEKEQMMGCLLAPHPVLYGATAIIICRDQPNGVQHVPAIAWVNLEDLYRISWESREDGMRDRELTLTRIMANVGVTIPEGMADEIDIVSDGQVDHDDIMRLGTASVPFILALMVALRSAGGCALEESEGVRTAVLAPGRKIGFAERTLRRAGFGRAVIRRKMVDGRPRLVWLRNPH